ncbi:SpoIIE family protein phosphatase [Candidatus Poribacteria bacterium]|nr:SpoIIE family protein phosphatase [Candidatus Poribacteria bacterium]
MLEEEKFRFLHSSELFSELTLDRIKPICEVAHEVVLPADHILFEEGDDGDSLYLLVEGEISIIKADTEVLTFNDVGYCFGEVALIDDKPRSATIKTLSPTKLLKISRDDFFIALAREPLIGRGIFRVLNNKIRHDLEVQMSSIRKEIAQEESIRLAAEVQQSILPNEEIENRYISSAGYCQPTNDIGGDYYDYLHLPDEKTAIFIGDVMGHGFHSALVAAMTKSCIQTQIRFDASVPEVMKAVKRVTEEDAQTFIYMTCCYVVIHKDNKFEFINAGHPSILLFRSESDEIIELDSQYTPVGIPLPVELIQNDYHSLQETWNPGDLLVMYSDGITEAVNEDSEMYGLDRFKQLVLENKECTPNEIKQRILSDLNCFQEGNLPYDDITLVVAKFGEV